MPDIQPALKNHGSQGFTLLEIAIIIGIATVVLIASIRFAVPLMESAKRMETAEKMNKIAQAISVYAVENNRIPCPAVPRTDTNNPVDDGFGLERNNGRALDDAQSRCGNNTDAWVGIIPFKTLGLSNDVARDAWGNYFTYAISPVMALPAQTATTSVQAQCRTRDWIYEVGGGYKNRNSAKAAFCCPGTAPLSGSNSLSSPAPALTADASDLAVNGDPLLDAAGNYVGADGAQGWRVVSRMRVYAANSVWRDTPNAIDMNYFKPADEPYNNLLPDSYIPIDKTPVLVAYTLVSHGSNGDNAAFNTADGTAKGLPPFASNPCEHENSDGDREFRDCRISDSPYNDDMTLWQTPDMIFANQNESCASP